MNLKIIKKISAILALTLAAGSMCSCGAKKDTAEISKVTGRPYASW